MKVSVNLVIEADKDTYTANLILPTAAIDATNPFDFNIVHKKENKASNVLSVHIEGTDKYSVNIEPPKALLGSAGDVVKELGLKIES